MSFYFCYVCKWKLAELNLCNCRIPIKMWKSVLSYPIEGWIPGRLLPLTKNILFFLVHTLGGSLGYYWISKLHYALKAFQVSGLYKHRTKLLMLQNAYSLNMRSDLLFLSSFDFSGGAFQGSLMKFSLTPALTRWVSRTWLQYLDQIYYDPKWKIQWPWWKVGTTFVT